LIPDRRSGDRLRSIALQRVSRRPSYLYSTDVALRGEIAL